MSRFKPARASARALSTLTSSSSFPSTHIYDSTYYSDDTSGDFVSHMTLQPPSESLDSNTCAFFRSPTRRTSSIFGSPRPRFTSFSHAKYLSQQEPRAIRYPDFEQLIPAVSTRQSDRYRPSRFRLAQRPILAPPAAPAPVTAHFRRHETQSSPCRQATSCAPLASTPRTETHSSRFWVPPSERPSCFDSPSITRSSHPDFDTLSTLSSGHCGTLRSDSPASAHTQSPSLNPPNTSSKHLIICQPKILEILRIHPGVTIPPWAAPAYLRHFKRTSQPPVGIIRVSHHPSKIPAKGLAADYAPLPPMPTTPFIRAKDPNTPTDIPPMSLTEQHSPPATPTYTTFLESIAPSSPSFIIRHSLDTSAISEQSSAHTVSFVVEQSFESSAVLSPTFPTSLPARTEPPLHTFAPAVDQPSFVSRCALAITSVATNTLAWVRSWFDYLFLLFVPRDHDSSNKDRSRSRELRRDLNTSHNKRFAMESSCHVIGMLDPAA